MRGGPKGASGVSLGSEHTEMEGTVPQSLTAVTAEDPWKTSSLTEQSEVHSHSLSVQRPLWENILPASPCNFSLGPVR